MDYSKLFDTAVSAGSIGRWRASGKIALGIVCAHVPPEIFHTLGILPVRLRATGSGECSGADAWMSTFGCSFAKCILQNLMDDVYKLDGVVVSDGCMLSVRIYDNWKYICKGEGRKQFVFEIAAPRKSSETTYQFYKEELEDLVSALEALSGNKLTEEKLRASIELYNEARRLLRRIEALQKQDNPPLTGEQMLALHISSTNMPIEEYIQLLRAFLADAQNLVPPKGYRARLLLIGSALDDPQYIKIIEGKGGLVVADTLCLGSMLFGDEIKLSGSDALMSLARYYLDRLVCPRMVDNRDRLHEYILGLARDFNVSGVIYQKMQYCECWGGENIFLEKTLKNAGFPMLIVEREQKLANAAQLEIRVEAFVEMIEEG